MYKEEKGKREVICFGEKKSEHEKKWKSRN